MPKKRTKKPTQWDNSTDPCNCVWKCECHAPAMGHAFSSVDKNGPDSLLCNCGTDWYQHQSSPNYCLLSLRQVNEWKMRYSPDEYRSIFFDSPYGPNRKIPGQKRSRNTHTPPRRSYAGQMGNVHNPSETVEESMGVHDW